MIFLFSSTSRDQYRQDALNVLALPPGAVYHFRYDKKWVDDDILGDLDRQRDQDAVVVLVIQPHDPAAVTAASISFYPLREACIIRLVEDGTIVHAYFTLGRYVDWRAASAAGYQRGSSPAPSLPPSRYLSKATGKDLALTPPVTYADTTKAPNAWEDIVTRMGALPDFAETVFYRMTGLSRVHAYWQWSGRSIALQDVPLQQIMPATTDNSMGYQLRPGRMYTLGLSFYHNEDVSTSVKGSAVSYSGPLCQDAKVGAETQNSDPSPSLSSSPAVPSGHVPKYTSAGVR